MSQPICQSYQLELQSFRLCSKKAKEPVAWVEDCVCCATASGSARESASHKFSYLHCDRHVMALGVPSGYDSKIQFLVGLSRFMYLRVLALKHF